ncbi:MAG: DNA/RNA non-specific endonuclease [Ornithinimicrobium sp.]
MIAHLGAVGNGKDSRNDDGEEPAMRSGFDNHFLGVLSPLPGAGGRSVTRVDYVHSTVVLDRDRRLALTSAVNINGAELREIERDDEWRYDPRIPETLQVGEEVYADNHLDRGHLVRRRDPVWGSAGEARQANRAAGSAVLAGIDLGGYRTYHVPIREIAALTGLELGTYSAADRFLADPTHARGSTSLDPPHLLQGHHSLTAPATHGYTSPNQSRFLVHRTHRICGLGR